MKNVEILPSGNISEPNVETKPSTINHESQAPAASNTGNELDEDLKPISKGVGDLIEKLNKHIAELECNLAGTQNLVRDLTADNYNHVVSLRFKLAQLQERNGELIETSTFQHQVILESEKEIAGLEKRNAELDRDLDETRDQMKTEKCDYCFDYDQKTDVIEKKLLSDYKKIADLEKRNAELVTKCHQLEFKLKTAEDKLAAVMEQKGRIDSNIEEIKKARSAGSIDKVAYALDQLCIKFLKERDAYREVAQSLNKIAYCGSSLYDDIDVEAQRLLSTKGETGRKTP